MRAPFGAVFKNRLDITEASDLKIHPPGDAEDVFYLTDFDNRPLNQAAAERLREHLVQVLDERQAALRAPASATVRA